MTEGGAGDLAGAGSASFAAVGTGWVAAGAAIGGAVAGRTGAGGCGAATADGPGAGAGAGAGAAIAGRLLADVKAGGSGLDGLTAAATGVGCGVAEASPASSSLKILARASAAS